MDFTQIKRYGLSITGDTYYHLEFGPIPTTIKNLVDSASDDPETALLSDIIRVHCDDGHDIHKIVCLQPFTKKDKEYFSQVELNTLEDVVKRFRDSSTQQIIDVSHGEAPWRFTKELEIIPYQLAAEDPDCIVDRQDINLLSKITV
ncbi:MAG: SocA family protein [Candidatus Magasanikbacteria bacterium]|nr:SocA family protein [Candidatus Magasanikbacteria bacterium]